MRLQSRSTAAAAALFVLFTSWPGVAYGGPLSRAAINAAEAWVAKRNATSAPPARQGDCLANYPGGKPPAIQRAALRKATRTLCFLSFAVVHSGAARAPLVSSTVLTPEGVFASSRLERVDAFRPELRLPPMERAELEDYRRNVLRMDRGHMTASADAPTARAQHETFSLANIVPQAAELNRGSWADLEQSVRRTARRATVYAATGPLYDGARLKTIGRVLVPTAVWKAVYVPGRGGQAWIATNSNKPVWTTLSIGQLIERTGIDPFPAVPAAEKARAVRVIRFDVS